ncbi:MAG TPA: IS5 family transposase [Anaerolineales bacterium]|nr:IS5 family transposase [Anaerolineales bacterium]
MRGDEERQESIILFASLEDRIPCDHPLREIRRVVDRALKELSPLFDELYHERGRESIPPEYLLRAQLIQHLYAIPSERRLCEQLEYNLLLRWFVGLPLSEPVWHPTSFTKNRDRVLTAVVAEAFFAAVRDQASARKLLSREHFSCDGTLIEAAASLKSFRPRDETNHNDSGPGAPPAGRNLDVDFRGERRSNDTHRSTTDPDARLARIKGKEAKLSYRGHLLTENRNGLIVDCTLTPATGKAEPEAALLMLARERGKQKGKLTVGADRGYNTRGFVAGTRHLGVTPHVARKCRFNAIDARTTGWPGYELSQRRRKVIEEAFGWMKTTGPLRKLLHRGLPRVTAVFTFACAAYNLVRLRRLLAEPALQ